MKFAASSSMCNRGKATRSRASWAGSGLKIRTTTSSASTERYYPQPKINFFFHFDSWRLNMRPGSLASRLCLHRRIEPQDRPDQDLALQGADPPLGLRPEGPGQERRVHPDSGGRSAIRERSERRRRRRDSDRRRAHVGTPGGRERRRAPAENWLARTSGRSR